MQSIEFNLHEDYIELIKLLKAVNLASSGGMAKLMVEEGEVQVNEAVEFRKRRKCRVGDQIRVSEIEIQIV